MKILFLGEGELAGPARYLAAVLTWANIAFDHRPDESRIPKPWRRRPYDAVVLSDYRYSGWTDCSRKWICHEVTQTGMGLLMIGGWASFTGLVGKYAETDIGGLLPVTCTTRDDRVQKATGALLLPSTNKRHGAGGFPVVCGYHRAKPKSGTHVPFVFRDLIYKNHEVTLGAPSPAVILGQSGRGRTAALLTDCAPHWAGGLVDWGNRRIKVDVKRGISVEVGNLYLNFMKALLHKVAKRKE